MGQNECLWSKGLTTFPLYHVLEAPGSNLAVSYESLVELSIGKTFQSPSLVLVYPKKYMNMRLRDVTVTEALLEPA